MRINVAVPEAHVDAPVLDAMLESVTRLDQKLLKEGAVPTAKEAIKKHGVRWQPEPPGEEHFDHAGTVMQRGHGDCDDLAPHHAASLRHTGEDPGAKAVVYRSGPMRWHAVVQRSDGSIDDPSRWAGMGQGVSGVGEHGFDVVGVDPAEYGFAGSGLPLMYAPSTNEVGAYIVKPQVAMKPVRGAYQARADLPWMWREHIDDPPTASGAVWSFDGAHRLPRRRRAFRRVRGRFVRRAFEPARGRGRSRRRRRLRRSRERLRLRDSAARGSSGRLAFRRARALPQTGSEPAREDRKQGGAVRAGCRADRVRRARHGRAAPAA